MGDARWTHGLLASQITARVRCRCGIVSHVLGLCSRGRIPGPVGTQPLMEGVGGGEPQLHNCPRSLSHPSSYFFLESLYFPRYNPFSPSFFFLESLYISKYNPWSCFAPPLFRPTLFLHLPCTY